MKFRTKKRGENPLTEIRSDGHHPAAHGRLPAAATALAAAWPPLAAAWPPMAARAWPRPGPARLARARLAARVWPRSRERERGREGFCVREREKEREKLLRWIPSHLLSYFISFIKSKFLHACHITHSQSQYNLHPPPHFSNSKIPSPPLIVFFFTWNPFIHIYIYTTFKYT